jgi:hypothetical protein
MLAYLPKHATKGAVESESMNSNNAGGLAGREKKS